ncbi:hypothetical protein A3H16_03130 [Candidatus Kaiserbacteria bacterium RIFCSPLOWO2_12_FULL_53_8]|uniref:Uncharacterized protein n=2 Tax=Candidatus Kaiseribacteriota TaxID=1752734 RepID=A0A1F6CVR1_9BACT|nr:MAG: hypothetical protein A2851_02705 [Candidatus Kaiserbacteria bacterium RIFCSPHIGHO2_01_FULL_53_29]OGG92173.1 MAG: hypothetical protein A3H16_03130 [Candidatus Kaiserbacteria bacterium RIFCSPLOWO2_12_FULL_53_8]
MYWTYLKTLTFLLALIVIFGGGYLYYRYDQSRHAAGKASLTGLAYKNDGKARTPREELATADGFAPIKCHLSAGGFHDSLSGDLYYADKSMFIHLQYAQRPDARVVVNAQGAYVWIDGQDDVHFLGPDDPAYSASSGIESPLYIIGNGDCEPWWFPDRTLFEIPTTRTIKPYPALR